VPVYQAHNRVGYSRTGIAQTHFSMTIVEGERKNFVTLAARFQRNPGTSMQQAEMTNSEAHQ